MFNKITLIGNLGSEPENKQSKSGSTFSVLSVATQNYGDETTEWFKVLVFGKMGEACQNNLKKGDRVYIEGALKSNTWEDDSGNARTNYSVFCNTVKFLSNKGKEDKFEPEQGDIPF